MGSMQVTGVVCQVHDQGVGEHIVKSSEDSVGVTDQVDESDWIGVIDEVTEVTCDWSVEVAGNSDMTTRKMDGMMSLYEKGQGHDGKVLDMSDIVFGDIAVSILNDLISGKSGLIITFRTQIDDLVMSMDEDSGAVCVIGIVYHKGIALNGNCMVIRSQDHLHMTGMCAKVIGFDGKVTGPIKGSGHSLVIAIASSDYVNQFKDVDAITDGQSAQAIRSDQACIIMIDIIIMHICQGCAEGDAKAVGIDWIQYRTAHAIVLCIEGYAVGSSST